MSHFEGCETSGAEQAHSLQHSAQTVLFSPGNLFLQQGTVPTHLTIYMSEMS